MKKLLVKRNGETHLIRRVRRQRRTYELETGKLARVYLPPSPPNPDRPLRLYRRIKNRVRLSWHPMSELPHLNQMVHQINTECVENYGKAFEVPTWDEIDAIRKFREFEERCKTGGKPTPKLSMLVERAIVEEEANGEMVLFREAGQRFLQDRKATVSESRFKTYIAALNFFGKSFDEKPLNEITVREVQDALNNGDNLSSETIRTYTIIIRQVVGEWFKEKNATRRLVDRLPDPLENLPTPKVVKTKEPEILSPEVLFQYLSEVQTKAPDLLVSVVLQGFCGLRASEVCRLHWQSVSKNYIFLSSSITKTKKSRTVEIPENCIAWLSLIKDKKPTDYVLCSSFVGADREKGINALKAKFTYNSKIKIPKNSLRKSYSSYQAILHGSSASAIATGHSVRVGDEYYVTNTTPEIARQYFSILPEPEHQD